MEFLFVFGWNKIEIEKKKACKLLSVINLVIKFYICLFKQGINMFLSM